MGLPIVYTVHGWSFHQDQKFPVRKIRELSEKFLTDKADLTISVSNSNQMDGITRFNMKRSKVVNYGIDLTKYNPNRPIKDIREELGIAPGKTVVGYIVRMTVQKDPLTLIKAIAHVAKETNGMQFLFIGDGDIEILRGEAFDAAEMRGGDIMKGTIKEKSWKLESRRYSGSECFSLSVLFRCSSRRSGSGCWWTPSGTKV